MRNALPLVALALGGIVGFTWGAGVFSRMVDPLLYVLLFLVGLQAGADRGFWRAVRWAGPRGVALGVGVMLAGAAGAGVAGVLVGMDPLVAAAVGGASGWYSLAGPVLVQVSPEGALLGVVVNLLRESATYALYPLLARCCRLAAVSIGGATSMDSTLPVILRAGGREAAALGMVQGLVITLLAPLFLGALVSRAPGILVPSL